MIRKLTRVACSYLLANRPVLGACLFFLIVQFLYSWMMWHRGGNLPPTPADSYNYLVNISQMSQGGGFFSDPRQLVYGSFNYFYSLISILFGISPMTTYHLFFYLGKVLLLIVWLYFISSFTKDKKIVAWSICALGAYSGTGATHGFFWVVPSFWSVLLFFLLVAMAVRGVNFVVILLICVLFIFAHPLSLYCLFPILVTYFVLWLKKSQVKKAFGTLAIALFIAIMVQQAIVYSLNDNPSIGEISQFGTVVGEGVIKGVGPTGDSVQGRKEFGGKVEIGLLSLNDVLIKMREKSPSDDFSVKIRVPSYVYRAVPSFFELWNSYSFFFVFLPVLIIALLTLFYFILSWGYSQKDPLIIFFGAVLLTALGATIHPQGFRFLVFLWPMTLFVLVYFFLKITQPENIFRKLTEALIIIFVSTQVAYGVFLASRISGYRDYNIDKACVSDLARRSRGGERLVIYYSNQTLAPTVFSGEGLNNVPMIDYANWRLFASDPEYASRTIIYFNDLFEGYGEKGAAQAVKDGSAGIAQERGQQVFWRKCGDFEYGEQK